MFPLTPSLALLLITLVLRSLSVGRRVRSKLLTSAVLFAAAAAAAALVAYAPLDPRVVDELRTLNPLVLTFAVINLVVALAINPWRVDRVPERFPNIVQDAIVIGLFALAAVLFMQEKIMATTAVGAVVIGFALQDTLGNLFAGLAIQVEKPFRVGDWVTIGGKDGLVAEITWRATKIRTKAGDFVIVPNSVLSRDTITNYSQPTPQTRLEIAVGVSYDAAPDEVKAVIREALRDEPLIVHEPEPEVLIDDFAASAVTYSVRAWTTEFRADALVRDRMRSRVYYALRRQRIAIPYPIQVQVAQELAPPDAAAASALDDVAIFEPLSADQRARLVASGRLVLYGSGETIVREGESGASLFVVVQGAVSVRLASASGEVARIGQGGYFGEMSLLTGDPRTATVVADTDCRLVEIDADAFRAIALGDPMIVDRVSTAVALRREELERHRATHSAAVLTAEAPQSFLLRVRQFLRA